MDYFKKSYFVYEEESAELVEQMESNEFGTKITSVFIKNFLDDIEHLDKDIKHVVVSISLKNIPQFLITAYKHNLSVGIVPTALQKEQIRNLHADGDIPTNIEIALRDDCKGIDLVQVNDKLIYSQGVIGTVPLISQKSIQLRSSFLRTFFYSIKKFFSIELQKFDITTENGQNITTAGSAVIILNHANNSFISKIFNFNQSIRDGKITIVIVSPFSIFEYAKLIASFFTKSSEKKTIPKSIGYIQSESFTINATHIKRVVFDNGESELLPIKCKIIPDAIKINASDTFWEHNKVQKMTKETLKIANLPDKNEARNYMAHKIPFFRSASEERFRELFQILRVDAKLSTIYVVLMVLSTFLASFGLFANSTAVIIGAMLVAPLMTPIVSISMGLLRAEKQMISNSLVKIGVGVFVALLASSVLAMLLPSSNITNEMMARVDPTLLDLGVAVFSGMAAAYSKAYKEIAQNLAGVAIAVALVPPLSVAGIGLGYGEYDIFFGAFLLFFTNLVGIILAAVITFEFLGYSNVVKSKKSVAFVFALILAISYPLYISYDKIIRGYEISTMLKEKQFIVNEKLIIIDKAKVQFHGDQKMLSLNIVVKDSLNKIDLYEFKKAVEQLLNKELLIKVKVEYIL